MPFQHPEEIGYGHAIERYVTRRDSDHPRYLELNSARVLRPGSPHAERFARHLIEDAATITDAELEALLAFEWRSRLTAAWLIGVSRRASFRERLGDLLLASEVCYSGSAYCVALARLGTHADAAVLTAYLDRYHPRTDLRYDQPAALGALLHLDARLGTHHARRSPGPTASGTSGSMRWSTCATTPPTHPRNSAAGPTSTALSPTAGPADVSMASGPSRPSSRCGHGEGPPAGLPHRWAREPGLHGTAPLRSEVLRRMDQTLKRNYPTRH